ncbi:HPr family phosphocarrier protein [Trinickia terrae]|uniref:HPr family phosphocarrier protein n=1 Tax=Trinickia terrae TaxID=2571161 RepID=UPI0034E1954B
MGKRVSNVLVDEPDRHIVLNPAILQRGNGKKSGDCGTHSNRSRWTRSGASIGQQALADTARCFQSDILLIANGRRINAKDMMAIGALQMRSGTSAQVLVTGPDEDVALHTIVSLLH